MLDLKRAHGRRRRPSDGAVFVLWLGGAGLLPLAASLGSLVGLSLGAADAGAQGGGATPAKPGATPAPAAGAMADKPPEISDEARALHGILIARYGKDLDATQTQSLLEAVENGVGSGKALRAKKLANGVEPGAPFAATPLATAAPAAAAAAAVKGGH